MFGERHTKDDSPFSSNCWIRRSVFISRLFGTGHGYKMGTSRKEPSSTEGDWKQSDIVSLSTWWLPLMLMAWEGSTDSLSYLLGLLLIALNCLCLKLLLFQLMLSSLFGVALCSWSTSVNTSVFGEENIQRVGWDVTPLLRQHQALHIRAWHIKVVMGFERWGLKFWS